MKILFLDDDKNRHDRFRRNSIGAHVVHVWNYNEAIVALSGERFDQIFLDHDLSWEAAMGRKPEDEKTGYDVAVAVASLPAEKRPDIVIVHSFNPGGAARMLRVLSDAGLRCRREPFNEKLAPR